jgi:hypothetical protein
MSASYCASWGDYASFFGLELRSGKADRSIGSSGGRSPRSDCTTEYEAKERAAALVKLHPVELWLGPKRIARFTSVHRGLTSGNARNLVVLQPLYTF